MIPRVRTLKTGRLNVVLGYLFAALLVLSILVYAIVVLNRRNSGNVVKILCFGDSLTVGSSSIFTTKSYPYSTKLKKLFDSHDRAEQGESTRAIYEVHNAGIPGERAHDQMFPRLSNILQDAKVKYSWVIILGGTNDLRKIDKSNASGDHRPIFDALVKLHAISHQSGAHTVAVTVPDRQCEVINGKCALTKDLRIKINELLRQFALSSPGKVVLADLAEEISLPRDQGLWSDAVHFTAEGYDKMADIVYNSMKKHI